MLLGGVLLAAAVFATPLSRTQEARVLEAAREMIDRPLGHWVEPRLNERVRLHKPPLATWLAAVSFGIFGVSTWSGRVPFVLAGLATIAVVRGIGRRLAGARVGTFSAAMMVGMLMFQRYARLAETDVLVLLSLTAAVYAFVRAAQTEAGTAWKWHHVSALAAAGAAMSKGPPVVLALLLLPATAWATGRWRIVRGWFTSGAPVTAAALGLPWWVFAMSHPEAGTLTREVADLTSGRGHSGHFAAPIGYLLKGALPWTPWLAAATWSCARWRAFPVIVRAALAWAATIVIVHIALPQKQEHYLLPALPALSLLGGWALDAWLGAARDLLRRPGGIVLGASVGGAALAAVVIPAWQASAGFSATVVVAAVAGLVSAVCALTWLTRRGATPSAAMAMLVATCINVTAVVVADAGAAPTIAGVAAAVKERCGNGPYAFFPIQNVPFLFEMRRTIPVFGDDASLLKAAAARPGLVVICETNAGQTAAPPAPFVREMRFSLRNKAISVYRLPERAR